MTDLITLEDLKSHMRITVADDDAMLANKITAASEWLLGFTGATYADQDAVPAPMKEACRLLAAHWYENSEASVTISGVTAQDLPFGVMDLIQPYREWAF